MRYPNAVPRTTRTLRQGHADEAVISTRIL